MHSQFCKHWGCSISSLVSTTRMKFPHRTRFWTAGLVCCSDWSWASITQRFTVHLLPRGPGLHPCSFPQLSCYFYTFILPGELLLKQQLSLNILSNVIHCVVCGRQHVKCQSPKSCRPYGTLTTTCDLWGVRSFQSLPCKPLRSGNLCDTHTLTHSPGCRGVSQGLALMWHPVAFLVFIELLPKGVIQRLSWKSLVSWLIGQSEI